MTGVTSPVVSSRTSSHTGRNTVLGKAQGEMDPGIISLVALLSHAVSSVQGRLRVTWNNAHRAGVGRTAMLLTGSAPVRGVAGNLGAQRPHEVDPVSVRCNREDETGWDLGPFATVLAPGQMSPRATKYKDAIKGLKQNKTKLHTRVVGVNTQLPLLKGQEQKPGVRSKSKVLYMTPAHCNTYRVGKPQATPPD